MATSFLEVLEGDLPRIRELHDAGDAVELERGEPPVLALQHHGVAAGVTLGLGLSLLPIPLAGMFVALALAPVLRPLHPHPLNLALQPADLVADQAAVGLELGLAGAAGADAAFEPLEVGPLAAQAREDVLVLRKLYLRLQCVDVLAVTVALLFGGSALGMPAKAALAVLICTSAAAVGLGFEQRPSFPVVELIRLLALPLLSWWMLSPIAAEATIFENAAGFNGGGYTEVCVGNLAAADTTRRAFVRYDLPSIPAGATIKGIEVRLDAKVDSTSGSPKLCVQLSSDGGSSWTTAKSTPGLTTSEATYVLGSASDLWGRTWLNGSFANSSFRVRVISVASSTSRDFSLDWVAVNVHYQRAISAAPHMPAAHPQTVRIARVHHDRDYEIESDVVDSSCDWMGAEIHTAIGRFLQR